MPALSKIRSAMSSGKRPSSFGKRVEPLLSPEMYSIDARDDFPPPVQIKKTTTRNEDDTDFRLSFISI